MFFYPEYFTTGFSKTLVRTCHTTWHNVSEHNSVHSHRHDTKPHSFTKRQRLQAAKPRILL